MTDASTAPIPTLVVGTDATAIKRSFRVPLTVSIVLAVFSAVAAVLAAAVMSAVAGIGLGMMFGFALLLFALFEGSIALRTVGKASVNAGAGAVLTLDVTGLSSNTSHGLLVLRWKDIASVGLTKRGRHQVITFWVSDGVMPDSPGVQTTIKPALFRRLSTRGFRVGSAGIDVPVQSILDATAAFTAGRLVAR